MCDTHLRMENVIHEGVVQRFCQQCSRFHLLKEFEPNRRSCRARLQRHNARRRVKAAAGRAARAGVSADNDGSFRRTSGGRSGSSSGAAQVASPRPQVRSARLAARRQRSYAEDQLSEDEEESRGGRRPIWPEHSAPAAVTATAMAAQQRYNPMDLDVMSQFGQQARLAPDTALRPFIMAATRRNRGTVHPLLPGMVPTLPHLPSAAAIAAAAATVRGITNATPPPLLEV